MLIASDGQQVIALTKAHKPDLILMDIQMPVMDGIEAIKQIRLDPDVADIPIIALTALAMTGDLERCLDAGANEYLQKPLKLKQLTTSIQQILNAKKNV
jgi:CheY-like chemotaxis protein